MGWAALSVSVLYIVLTCTLAQIARRIVEQYVRQELVKSLLEEAIAAAELCASCFELVIVADNFGISTYAVFLFLLTIWWSWHWGDATACPYNHLEDMCEGRTDFRTVLLKSWAELIGGVMVFKYVQMLWNLEVSVTHRNRAFADCTTDLQVPVLYGALIEGIATCVCRLSSRIISDSGIRFATAINSFISTSLVLAAFNYSGGYFNPVLATSLKFGCSGDTITEHVIVYWIGACTGSVMSVFIYRIPFIKNMFAAPPKVD